MSGKDPGALFRKFDLDGDGRISREELREALTAQRGTPPTDAQLEATLLAFDDDGDGMISQREFAVAVEAFSEARDS